VRQNFYVAPHAGAWIETLKACCMDWAVESRPTRARGLKRIHQDLRRRRRRVAPHAGAWIETPTTS